MWYLLNPNTGAGTITVTLSGQTSWTAAGVSYVGVAQTGTFRASCNTESGNSGTNANLSVTSQLGDLAIDAITNVATGPELTVGGGQTQRQNQTFAAGNGLGGYSEETAAGATTRSEEHTS